jgi:hypothetical protein
VVTQSAPRRHREKGESLRLRLREKKIVDLRFIHSLIQSLIHKKGDNPGLREHKLGTPDSLTHQLFSSVLSR